MQLVLEDFRFGLDRRKFMLNSPAGTLYSLQNAHITSGGEIEKRKKFHYQYLPTNCYGLEVTEDGFEVFGSVVQASLTAGTQVATTLRSRASNVATLTFAADPNIEVGDIVTVTLVADATYNAAQVTVTAASSSAPWTISYANTGSNEAEIADTTGRVAPVLPAGVTYTRLQHPDGAGTAMTGVVHSAVYDGLAFVVATFSDGTTFAFYDGSVVLDLFAGRKAAWLTDNEDLAAHLNALINRSSSYSSSYTSSVVTVTTPSGVDTEVSVDEDSSAGTLASARSVTQVDGINGVSAAGQFTIVAGTASAGVNKVANVKVNSIEILPAAVDWTTSNNVTAAAVKDAINGRASGAKTIASYSRTGTTVTLTMVDTPAFLAGDEVTVAGVTPGVGTNVGIHGTWVLTAVNTGAKTLTFTSDTDDTASGTGGTVTMDTRWVVAEVNNATVELLAGQTGTALNDKLVSVTTAGAVCVDEYSFKLMMNSGATTSAVPQITALFINGVQKLAAGTSGTDIEGVIAAVAADATLTASYAAVAVGNTLYLSRYTTTSDSAPLSVMIIVDDQGGVAVNPGGVVTVDPGPDNSTFFGPATANLPTFVGELSLFANVSGGTPPYTYKWGKGAGWVVSSGTLIGNTTVALAFLPNDTQPQPQIRFTRNNNNYHTISGQVNLTVTDADGRKATGYLDLTCVFFPYA